MENKLFGQGCFNVLLTLQYDRSDGLSPIVWSKPSFILQGLSKEMDRNEHMLQWNKFFYHHISSFSSHITEHREYYLAQVNGLLRTNFADPNLMSDLPVQLDDATYRSLFNFFKRDFVKEIPVDPGFYGKYIFQLNKSFWRSIKPSGNIRDSYIALLQDHEIPTLTTFRLFDDLETCFITALLAIDTSGSVDSHVQENFCYLLAEQVKESKIQFTPAEKALYNRLFDYMDKEQLFPFNAYFIDEDSLPGNISVVKHGEKDKLEFCINLFSKLKESPFTIFQLSNC